MLEQIKDFLYNLLEFVINITPDKLSPTLIKLELKFAVPKNFTLRHDRFRTRIEQHPGLHHMPK